MTVRRSKRLRLGSVILLVWAVVLGVAFRVDAQATPTRVVQTIFTGYVQLCPEKPNRPPIQGVTLQLYRAVGPSWVKVDETASRMDGSFRLSDNQATGARAADYQIKELDVPGYTSCTANTIEHLGVASGTTIGDNYFYDSGDTATPSLTVTTTPVQRESATATATWTPTPTGTPQSPMLIHLPLVGKDYPPRWRLAGLEGMAIKSLAVDPSNPQVVYAGTSQGLYWRQYCDGDWSKTTLPDVGVYSIAVASSPAVTVLVGTWGEGMYRSLDGSMSWEPVNNGLGSLYVNAVAISPNFAADQTIYAGTDTQGVYRSVDGGDTWQSASLGLGSLQILSISINPSDPRLLLAGTFDKGIYRSTDGGDSWTAAPVGNVIVWCLTFSRGNLQEAYAGTDGGVYRSDDAGQTWRVTGLGAKTYSLAIHPAQPGVAYAGTSGSGAKSTSSGGTDWQDMSEGLLNRVVQALALDWNICGLLYAGTNEGIWQWRVKQ